MIVLRRILLKYHVLKHLKVNPFSKDTFHRTNYLDYIKQNFKKKKNTTSEKKKATGTSSLTLLEEKPAVEIKPAKEEEGGALLLFFFFIQGAFLSKL